MAPAFVRPTVAAMAGYIPGEQPRLGERVVKINTNENPFPPSPKVIAAIRQIEPELLRRYPNPTADAFRAVAAKLHEVSPDMIVAGNGSEGYRTNVRSSMKRIRNKFRAIDANFAEIENFPAFGYRWLSAAANPR